jgi:hypothetical protein
MCSNSLLFRLLRQVRPLSWYVAASITPRYAGQLLRVGKAYVVVNVPSAFLRFALPTKKSISRPAKSVKSFLKNIFSEHKN